MNQTKKPRIPYEIKNAREWDPNKNLKDYSSSEGSDEEDYDEDDFDEEAYSLSSLNLNEDQASERAPSRSDAPTQRSRDENSLIMDGDRLLKDRVVKAASIGNPGYGGPNRKLPALSGVRHRRPRTVFNYNKDNLARAAFRKRLPPNGKLTLHKDAHEIDPDRKRMYDLFEEIGVRLRSFIRPPQHMHDRELLVWGNPRQVSATVAELKTWLARSEEGVQKKSKAKENFSRELSSLEPRYKALQRKVERDALIHRYQQIPEPGRHYECTGAFLWPVDEVKPQDIFGPSLEAFDPIRFQYRCHIIFDEKQTVIRAYSDDIKSIQESIRRFEGALQDFIARSSRPITVNMVEPPDVSTVRKEVKMLTESLSDPKAASRKIPMLTGGVLDPRARNNWMKENQDQTSSNANRMEQALHKTLPKLPFYRGQVKIRIHFGTFALTLFRWPEGKVSIPFEEFMKNLAQSGTKGTMIRDLQFRSDAASIMNKIYRATSLLQAVSGIGSNHSLNEVTRTYGARFEINRFDKPSIQLQVEMNSSPFEPEMYEKTQTLWSRLDRKDNSTPLDIFMIRLGGGASWKFQVSTENILEAARIDPKMTNFADSIKLKKILDAGTELTGRKIFEWETDLPGSLKPSVFEQKTAFRYRLVHASQWVFEIARYDSYGDPSNPDTPIITHWGATMWNTEWDVTLSDNAGLGIGESAKWDANLETFFPSNSYSKSQEVNAGVMEFLQNVQMVTDFLDDIKKTPLDLLG